MCRQVHVWALPLNIDFWSQWSDKREETLLCHQHPKQNSFDTPSATLCIYAWVSWSDKWWSVMVDFYQVNPWMSQLMRPVRSTRSDLKYALASKHTCFFSDRVRKMNLFASNGWFLLRPKWPDVKMLGSGKTILDAAGWDERLVHKIMLVLQPRPTYNIHIVWMGCIGDPVEALQLHLLPSQRTSKSLLILSQLDNRMADRKSRLFQKKWYTSQWYILKHQLLSQKEQSTACNKYHHSKIIISTSGLLS